MNTDAATATSPADAAAIAACCGHRRVDHDAISWRFCAATVAGTLARGCICRVPPAGTQPAAAAPPEGLPRESPPPDNRAADAATREVARG